MGSEKWGRFERVIALWALLLGSMVLVCVIIGLSNVFFKDSNAVASWVQAFGSIAAIAAGFGVAHFQIKESNRQIAASKLEQRIREIEEQRLAKRAQYLVLAYLHVDVFSWAESAIEGLKPNEGAWRAAQVNCVDLIARVDSLKINEYPNMNLAPIISSLRLKMRSILMMLELAESENHMMAIYPRINMRLGELKSAAECLLDLAFYEAEKHATSREKAEDAKFINDYKSTVFSHFASSPSDTDPSQTPPQPAAYQGPTAGS